MANDARAIQRDARVLSLDWIVRDRHSVEVVVIDRGHEVDSFRASSPRLLRASLRLVSRHLLPARQALRFVGIEEQWMLGGFRRTRKELDLPDLTAALSFLDADSTH